MVDRGICESGSGVYSHETQHQRLGHMVAESCIGVCIGCCLTPASTNMLAWNFLLSRCHAGIWKQSSKVLASVWYGQLSVIRCIEGGEGPQAVRTKSEGGWVGKYKRTPTARNQEGATRLYGTSIRRRRRTVSQKNTIVTAAAPTTAAGNSITLWPNTSKLFSSIPCRMARV